jgi:polysaccharide chain length determinant protein (PEP-CTERM system associated)
MTEELDDQKATRGMDEYAAIFQRRKWWILGPLFFGWLLVFVSTWVIPATYTSESVILVEEQKVPKSFVEPNVQVDMAERVQSITQQVLSRTRLLNLIQNLKLYPRYENSPDDQVKRMVEDIKFELVQAPPSAGRNTGELVAFKIDYEAPNPASAQAVNAKLASFFIDENVRASQEQSEATTLFLNSQLRSAEEALADQEAKLHAYEAQHEGSLPSELPSNLEILSGNQAQLQSALGARERALQQQTYLNSLLNQYQSMGPESMAGAPATIDGQLEAARAALAQLRARYTEDHPDIRTLKDNIARLEKLKKDMGAEAKDNLESNTATPAQVAAMTPVMQVQSQLKANKQEIQGLEARIQQLQAAVQKYEQRVSETPAVQAQMEDIMSNYEASKKSHDALAEKAGGSSLATNLERQQQGEQFRLIDPPSLPDKASFPDRFRFSLAGLAVGIILAVLFGAGMEFVDDRIRTEQDLVEAVALPVLVEIPALPTEAEIRRARWSPWITAAATLLVLILIPSGIVYAWYWG